MCDYFLTMNACFVSNVDSSCVLLSFSSFTISFIRKSLFCRIKPVSSCLTLRRTYYLCSHCKSHCALYCVLHINYKSVRKLISYFSYVYIIPSSNSFFVLFSPTFDQLLIFWYFSSVQPLKNNILQNTRTFVR